MISYGSVCSGIEAATVAWHPLGWVPSFFSEIEKFPREVLAHHYPDVPLHGDFTTIGANQYGPIDLLVGGTPCQSFSIAGLRGGLDDDRGNLALEFIKLAQRTRPRWLVWENVPGVLSSNKGRDFGTFLTALGEIGYGFAYRVLDAQYFGVAQRRRRIFVVGYIGDWRRAAAVLFERESLSGNPAPSREKGQVTPTLTKECTGVSRTGHNEDGWYVPTVSATLTRGCDQRTGRSMSVQDAEQNHFVTTRIDVPEKDVVGTLSDGAHMGGGLNGQDAYSGRVMAVAFQSNANACDAMAAGDNVSTTMRCDAPAVAFGGDIARTLSARYDSSPCADRGMDVVAQSMAVRRLTPVECERLQGFPDNYTNIKEKCPDGPRYKSLGNTMAVPVMHWIGKRIQMVEDLCQSEN